MLPVEQLRILQNFQKDGASDVKAQQSFNSKTTIKARLLRAWRTWDEAQILEHADPARRSKAGPGPVCVRFVSGSGSCPVRVWFGSCSCPVWCPGWCPFRVQFMFGSCSSSGLGSFLVWCLVRVGVRAWFVSGSCSVCAWARVSFGFGLGVWFSCLVRVRFMSSGSCAVRVWFVS